LQKLEKRKLEAAATERFEYARKIKGAIGQFSNLLSVGKKFKKINREL
jgi:hypothetical protein